MIDFKMLSLPSFFKLFTAITLMFFFFQNGLGRELIIRSSKGVDRFATTAVSRPFQESREIMELDYEDAGPNINQRSGLTQPLPSPEPASPAHG